MGLMGLMKQHHLVTRFGFLLGLSILSGFLTHCKQAESPTPVALHKFTYQQALMGTRFYITLYAENQKNATLAATEAFQLAANVNRACSDYDVTSELMQLNAAPSQQAVTLSPLLFAVLDKALNIAKQTDGAYDPTLGHHSYNWRMARKKGVLPTPEKIAEAISSSGWHHLQLDSRNLTATKKIDNMRLDLGGIAKGYAADIMLDSLQNHHITRASVTAGGEVRLGDPPPGQTGWRVTLKTLDENHQISPEVVELSNCAISTSGDLHQSITIGGQRYSHIVDPKTGLGLTQRVSATIIGKQATITDALATAYCVFPTLNVPEVQTLVIWINPNGEMESRSSDNWIR
jgi:thiamine biosynthesis lipoprotein